MPLFILDTSVAVKWFFTDEPGREQAKGVLSDLVSSPDRFVVPDLFLLELTAVLLRKTGFREGFVNTCLENIYELGISTVPVGRELTQKAVSLSCRYKLSFYDGVFVATAQVMTGVWLTSDRKAARKLPRDLVQLLGE